MRHTRCCLALLIAALTGTPQPAPALDPATLLDNLTRPQNYEARRESSSNPDITKNGDARPIEPGGELTLADIQGPGIITHFWNTLNAKDPFHGRSLILRVYYDGAEHPSVEAPLGDFFAAGYGALAEIDSAAIGATSYGRSRTAWWRMPFQKHLRMTITNESPTQRVESFYYYLDWQKHTQLPPDTPYFHAHYRQAHPATPGNFTVLDTKGNGHFVGMVHSALHMDTGWYGEGDDFFYIDGEDTPRLKGTGTEDYFNDAWGFRQFCRPYYGVPIYEGVLPGDRVTAYRWHIPDPIPFKQSLRVEIEHRGSIYNENAPITNMALGGFEERTDWISSVAYWYQHPPATFQTPIPPLTQRMPPYRIIDPASLPYRADPPLLVAPTSPGLMYGPNTTNAAIEFDLELTEPGRYQIMAIIYHSLMGGIYQPLLNGKPIGPPIDTLILNADPKWIRLDTHDLPAGKHILRFEGREGNQPQARALGKPFRALGIQNLILLRLQDMAGYKAVTERLLGGK